MPRFAGIKNNNICWVSDKKISSNHLVVEIPVELDDVSSNDLIIHFKYKCDRFFSKLSKKKANQLRVAFVTNWKMKCGIATFAENLLPEISKQLGDYKLFIENTENSTGPIDDVVPKDKISICWERGQPLTLLVEEIKKFNPDIVWINHEFGLFPNARYWLAMLCQLSDYRIIVTMHSIFHHMDKAIIEAAIPEIVVHLDGAVKVLKEEKQISSKVYVIPHGCYPVTNTKKLWNFYKSDKTFMQFGFGLRYKNWETSIKAAAILKKKYDDVFFTGLFSESDHAKIEHQLYYNELINLINSLGIQENVSLIRGFQSEVVIDTFLRTNQATIFPYISQPSHEVFGASGAARMAMSKGLPVITSNANHFSDLPTIKADSPEDLAAALETIFLDPKAKQSQITKQLQYIEENNWTKVAEKYINIFES